MGFLTEFAVKDLYTYLEGFGAYHQSVAVPGANPAVINSPKKAPFGLKTERISGTSFTALRSHNLQTWMYRVRTSMHRTAHTPVEDVPQTATKYSPNSYMWPTFQPSDEADWTSQKLLAKTGDPMTKTGLAIWLFNANRDMPVNSAYASLDGDLLVIPQYGALDIQTELGSLLVRQNEIAVLPRGIKCTVKLPTGNARGYICELYQGHYTLPELGPIGSTGLANVRDFQVPTASFQGKINSGGLAEVQEAEWKIFTRQGGRLWECYQDSTPFDVVGWHGTFYPYKYDLAKFCVLGNLSFDEHDPSMFVVLTAPSFREVGTSVVDFAILPPRWNVARDTLLLPYYHRNTMTEFFGIINSNQSADFPLNRPGAFMPFGAGMNGPMVTHGANSKDLEEAQTVSNEPHMTGNEGVTIMLIETEMPLYVSEWAEKESVSNFRSEVKRPSKI